VVVEVVVCLYPFIINPMNHMTTIRESLIRG
jgi:hypothetical protein